MWYNQAGANGLDLAIENRDRLAEGMTAAQVAEAQQLAREWTQQQLNTAVLEPSPREQEAAVARVAYITAAAPPAADTAPATGRKILNYGPRHHGVKRRR
jgi:hypothetical protein